MAPSGTCSGSMGIRADRGGNQCLQGRSWVPQTPLQVSEPRRDRCPWGRKRHQWIQSHRGSCLLEPTDDGSQPPGISPEASRWCLAQFEANPGILSDEPVLTVTLLTIWSRFQCIAKCLIASTPLTWVRIKQLSDFPTSRQQQVIYGRY